MSTDGSVDSATIEKTKQQIRSLVQEIAQLSRSEMGPEQYYAEVLHRIVTALAANGGAVWTIDPDRRLRLDYQINIPQNIVDPDNPDSQKHFKLVQEVITGTEPKLAPPMSGGGGPDAAGNPTNSLIVLTPLQSDDAVEGVLEVFQRADSQPGSQQGYLRFLVQMSQHVGDWLKARKLKTFSDRQSFWAKVNNFSKDVHDSLDVRETAYVIANESRRLIECDRVTVTTSNAGKQVVQAVSGQDTIDMRANMVTLVQGLASRVCATGEPLWYNGKTDDLPPQVEKALEAYIDESHTKSLAIVPLRKADMLKQKSTDELGTDETAKYQSSAGKVIGSIIVEHVDSTQSREMVSPRVEEIAQQSSRALGNALEHNELFLMPLWRTIGKSRALTTAKNLPKTLLVSGLILAVLVCLFILRKDLELKAEGTLEPVIKRKVFVAEDGLVTDVKVKHGAEVKAGATLLVTENKELLRQIEERSSRRGLVAEQLANLIYRGGGQRQQNEQSQAELEVQLKSLDAELKLLNERKEQLEIKSPIDGQIITWNVYDSLHLRPVGRGQEVMRVADPTGDWRLEVFLPEKRVGHMLNAQRDLEPTLKVSYVLKSNPDVKLIGTLERVQESAEQHEDHGQSFRLFVTIDDEELRKELNKELKQGTEVIAKVKCGRATLGYCWFHELFEWIQTMLFSI